MKLISAIVAEAWGLFVDDENLALHIVLLIAGVAALVKGAGLPPLAGGLALLAGCLALLVVSLRRGRRT